VIFVDASTHTTIESAFREFASDNNIWAGTSYDLYYWLETYTKSWLLIFDNLDEGVNLADVIPRPPRDLTRIPDIQRENPCMILVTTRCSLGGPPESILLRCGRTSTMLRRCSSLGEMCVVGTRVAGISDDEALRLLFRSARLKLDDSPAKERIFGIALIEVRLLFASFSSPLIEAFLAPENEPTGYHRCRREHGRVGLLCRALLQCV
jgi:hypothetical protein